MKTLKRNWKKITAGLIAPAAFAAPVWATHPDTGVHVKERVNLTWRSVSLKNVVTGANESIPMWTFSSTSRSGVGSFTFGGTRDNNAPFPGPVLVFREGDAVEYTFNDTCPCEWGRASSHPYAGHTIHLHGLDVATKEDGVHDTSFSILPGQSYTYKMATREAGSYIYHCHIHTVLHQQMGMYGGIVVMPRDGSLRPFTGSPNVFSKQYYWVTAEVDKSWHDKANSGNFGDSTEFSFFSQYNPQHFLLANYLIDTNTLNTDGSTPGRGLVKAMSLSNGTVTARPGESILLRLGNLGYLNHRVNLGGLKFSVVASDGKPLKDYGGNFNPLLDQTTIEVGPGERYDLIINMPTTTGTYTAKVEFLDPYTKAPTAGGKGILTNSIVIQ